MNAYVNNTFVGTVKEVDLPVVNPESGYADIFRAKESECYEMTFRLSSVNSELLSKLLTHKLPYDANFRKMRRRAIRKGLFRLGLKLCHTKKQHDQFVIDHLIRQRL